MRRFIPCSLVMLLALPALGAENNDAELKKLYEACLRGNGEACRQYNAAKKDAPAAPSADAPKTIEIIMPEQAPAPAPAPTSAPAPAPDAAAKKPAGPAELSSVLVFFSVGPVFQDYGGGGIALSLGFGGSGVYLVMGGRFQAGAKYDDSDPMWVAGAEFGLRGVFRTKSGMAPHFTLAAAYDHMWQVDLQHNDEMYDWHVPKGRAAFGFLWGKRPRLNFGFEISYWVGYAFHANDDENPWGENYDHVYHGGELRYLMTF